MQWKFKGVAGLLAALALAGCESFRFDAPADRAALRTPASWSAASRGHDGRISRGWLDEFDDPGMRRAVEAALRHNGDLAAAAARMREAEYNAIAGRARLLPEATLRGSGSLTHLESGPGSRQTESYGLTVAASWEPDLWGRLRDLTAADNADAFVARSAFRNARLSLAAATARAWCNLIEANQQVELAGLILDSFERNLRISERNYKGTGEGALDVQFGRTNVAGAKRSLAASRQQRDEAARSLEVLTGRYPAAAIEAGDELPRLRDQVPVGLPAGLVERRPDLEIARARIFASARRADASRKNLLPSLGLSGDAGTPVNRFSQLLDPDALVAGIGANLLQAFDLGGALRNQARAALEANRAVIAEYAQIALEAFEEVENALAAEVALAEQERHLMTEVEQARLAEKQASRDYSEGIEGSDILDVLEAQRRLNNSRSLLIRLRNQRLLNRIDLHLALGGDFETEEF